MDRCDRPFPCVKLLLCRLVELPVDPGNFRDPALALAVIQGHDLFVRPMQVIGDEGYLLEQSLRGVADHSPTPLISSSNLASHCGQVTPTRLWPFSLMRR